jgi:hypothetical protein
LAASILDRLGAGLIGELLGLKAELQAVDIGRPLIDASRMNVPKRGMSESFTRTMLVAV